MIKLILIKLQILIIRKQLIRFFMCDYFNINTVENLNAPFVFLMPEQPADITKIIKSMISIRNKVERKIYKITKSYTLKKN